MENYELTWKIRAHVETDRKPFCVDDLVCQTPFNSLPSEIQEAINNLPKINGHEYFRFGDEDHGFFSDVLDGDQQLYLMEMDGRKFFIDTQGYKYARYVGELI